MKVGLCACYENRNYGSMLQAYANQVAIELLGHECEMIKYQKKPTSIELMKQLPRIFNSANQQKYVKRAAAKKIAKQYPDIEKKRQARNICFDSFRKRIFTKVSAPYVGYSMLKKGSKNYDVVMVGSDQLWLPMGLPTNFYNLMFVDDTVRKVSYATSFGVSGIPWYQRSRTAKFLQRIEYLSVREKQGANIVKELSGREAELVVDPTLLLSYEQWMDYLPNDSSVPKEPYIFCYFLGKNPLCREEAEKVKMETGYPIVALKHLDEIIPSDEDFGDGEYYEVDPSGFVNLIRNAAFVLTDSFHGTVFSIINHKSFATYYRFPKTSRQSRNSRIDSILSNVGLTGRLVCEEGLTLGILNDEINYKDVDDRLDLWRSDSWNYLANALEQSCS